MKKQLSVLLSLIACICFISCQKESVNMPESKSISNAIADGKTSSNIANKMNETKVPFKGTYTTTAQLLQGPPLLRQRITGNGQATQLGASMFVAIATVNLTTPPPFQVSGTQTFTAANGDKFYTQFTGTNTPTGNGTATSILQHTIVGGTGRFENVSGSFIGTVYINTANPTNTVVYDGHLSY